MIQTVYKAIEAGYRLFDGACDYGNEKEAGDGVRKAIADGLVKREELCKHIHGSIAIVKLIYYLPVITSKLWNTFHKYEHVRLNLNPSLLPHS